MNEEFDYQVKLGSLFEGLNGIDLPIEEFDFPVANKGRYSQSATTFGDKR